MLTLLEMTKFKGLAVYNLDLAIGKQGVTFIYLYKYQDIDTINNELGYGGQI